MYTTYIERVSNTRKVLNIKKEPNDISRHEQWDENRLYKYFSSEFTEGYAYRHTLEEDRRKQQQKRCDNNKK